MDPQLIFSAIVSGLLAGCFYAALTAGITISFGMLDIANIAHAALMLLGAFLASVLYSAIGIDPLLGALLLAVPGYFLGVLYYRFYYLAFEKKGGESLQGLVFFFGVMFIIEISLLTMFGADYRTVSPAYANQTIELGFVRLPLRTLIPAVIGALMVVGIHLVLRRTFVGRGILAVSQDPAALALVGASPRKIKGIAFGIAAATALIAGALLVIIQPVEPITYRDFIGRMFAICVLGGMTSLPGTLLAACLLGIAESLTATFVGPSWSLAVSFIVLIGVIAFRPAGIFGR